MSEYTEADMKFDSDPLMQEEDYIEESAFDMALRDARAEWNEWWGIRDGTMKILYCQLLIDLLPSIHCVLNRDCGAKRHYWRDIHDNLHSVEYPVMDKQ